MLPLVDCEAGARDAFDTEARACRVSRAHRVHFCQLHCARFWHNIRVLLTPWIHSATVTNKPFHQHLVPLENYILMQVRAQLKLNI